MATQWTDITESTFYGDLAGYIRYANQLFRNDGAITSTTSNAMRVFRISENTAYRVTMNLRNRFRLGCVANLTTGQTVTNYVFDPLDTNDAADQNGAVRSLEITSGVGQVFLCVGAWSAGASETIENTLATIIAEEAHTAFTVQFVDWDGAVLKSETVSLGGSATPPPDPTREGYTFAGWDGDYTNITADTTITVQYVEGSLYTVTFVDWNGEILKAEAVGTGGSATPPSNPTREGYTFIGWDGSYTDIQADTMVSATYTILTFTVVFKDWDGVALKSEIVDYGSDMTPPVDPVRSGYLFNHWNGVYTNITADTTITAVYVIDPSTLTDIEITTPPTKTAYKQGEAFDGTGLVVSAVYSIAGTVAITDYTLSGFDTGTLGICTVTAEYLGQTAAFDLTFTKNVVTEECGYPTLSSIVATLDVYTGEMTVSGTGTMKSYTQSVQLLSAYRNSIRSVVISEGVTSIGSDAFQYDAELTSVILPQSLLSVRSSAFCMTGLTSITLPSSVNYIADNVFRGCHSLTTANLNTVSVSIGICLFYDCPLLTDVTLPPAITSIPNSAFFGCTSLESISLPDTITMLAYSAFKGCTALTSFTAPRDLTQIDDYVFENAGLSSFNANEKLTSVGSHAFNGCSKLASLSLPNTMNSIESTAFYNTGLTSIYIDTEYGFVSGTPWGATGATVTWRTAPLDYLEMVSPPTKTAYLYGEAFDTTGLALKIHYTDGTSADVEYTSIEDYDSSTFGEQTVYIVYRTLRIVFTVTVGNYILRLEITTLPTKTEYNAGELLDVAGMVVSQVYADETIEIISDYTVSEINYNITGFQNITVSSGEQSASFTITCHFPVTLESLLDNTNGMTVIRNNSRNDDSTDTLTGADWFVYNNTAAENVYVSGNNYIGFGSNSEQLRICNRDGATYYVYRLDGTLTNGHRFLKIRVDGTTYYSQYTDDYRLIYELYLFDGNDDFPESMFLNVIRTPTNASYMGGSSLICGDVTQTFAITANTQPKFSFYAADNTGAAWTVDSVCHSFLGSGISVTPPEKTSYLIGDEFDNTGMAVYMQTEAYGDVEITGYTLSGFDSTTVGTKTITVAYRDFSAAFHVIVGGIVTAEIGSPNAADVVASLDIEKGELIITGAGAIMDFVDTHLFSDYSAFVQSVVVSEGITAIGNSTFANYPQCTISLPSTLVTVGNNAFSSSGFTNLTIPQTLTSIGTGAFSACLSLMAVTIPGSVVSVPDEAFSGCTALTKVNIGNGVISIAASAFSGCTSLTNIVIDDRRDAFSGAPWGAENANIVWLRGGLYVYWLDWDEIELKREVVEYQANGTPPAEPVRSGYLFSGWDTSFLGIKQDTTIHAQYNVKSIFLVEFKDYDGRVMKSEYLTLGSVAVPPTNPSRDGYIFTGWDVDCGYISSDLVITATYSERADEYTVTFKNWDGTVLKEETVRYGHSATAPTLPPRDGYYFLSWSRSFGFITADTVTVAQYRQCRAKTAAEVFSGETKVGEIQKVTACTISRKLNGECTLSLSTLASLSDFVQPQNQLEISGLIFDIVGIEKRIQSGMYGITINGEHVSYILNNEEYCIDSFDFTGTPSVCLARLLEGTPFSIGTVDYTESVTLKINKEGTTRRDAVMQLIALCGGEIEYDGYSIGIRSHVGSSERVYLMDTLNVKDVSMSYDARNSAESYSIQLFKRVTLSVGDEVNITFSPLGINTDKRITEITYSPFNAYHIDVSLGSYRPTLSDSLYSVSQQSSTNSTDTSKLESRLGDMEHTLNSLSGSANSGGFKVKSVTALPSVPDNNTIYLIRGEVVVQ